MSSKPRPARTLSPPPSMESPIYRAWAKGIRDEAESPGYSAKWVTSRRGWLSIYRDRLEFGGTVIPAESVSQAILYETRQSFIPVSILAVTTPNDSWQFGVNPWVDLAPHLPFAFKREKVRLQHSTFSVIIRVALFAYVGYAIYRRIIGN